MSQWEDKLGAILNDPQAMSRIMALARSLEGGQETPAEEPEPVQPAAPALDPRLMEAGMRALAAWQGEDDRRTALLQALRPFVKPGRQAKLDKAAEITRLSGVVRAALDGLKGGESPDV